MKNSFIRTALFVLLLVAFQDLSYSDDDSDCEFIKSSNDAADLQLPPQYLNWMGSIDDRKKISQITIPGTHDTMALHGAWLGAKCQAWSLEDQLKAGIRYLDLRVKLSKRNKSLKLVHGPVSQKARLPEVLNIIKTFLKNHNTETVLVRVKPENTLNRDKLNVKLGVQKLLDEDPEIHAWVESSIPTLKDVRGKVVFIQKKEFDLGIEITGTDESGDYKVTNLQKKCQLIQEHLEEAKEKCRDEDHEEIILTYSSGTGCPCGRPDYKPRVVAKFVNPCLNDYLTNHSKDTCFGVIAMDFPSFDLIQKVIDVNKAPTVTAL